MDLSETQADRILDQFSAGSLSLEEMESEMQSVLSGDKPPERIFQLEERVSTLVKKLSREHMICMLISKRYLRGILSKLMKFKVSKREVDYAETVIRQKFEEKYPGLVDPMKDFKDAITKHAK